MLAGTILLTVQEFRHLFGTLREAIAKPIGIRLLGLDVKLILAFQIVKMANGQLEDVGLLQLRDVFFAVTLGN